MTDVSAVARPAGPQSTTAGGLLRQARQAQGLHIAALAAAIKVTPRKLESLESDRYDELPDATFTRALAQAMCRTLKVDAVPVLALLPPPNGDGRRLEQVAEGLNTPFRERPGRLAPKEWAWLSSIAVWGSGLLLLAAGVAYLSPPRLWSALQAPQRVSEDSIPAVPPDALMRGAETATVAAVPAPAAAATATADPATAGSAAAASLDGAASAGIGAVDTSALALQFRASGASWINVTDSSGQPLLSRILKQGETVGVEGALPLKVSIGNARDTQLVYRGQPMELAAVTKNNVARFEIK